MAYDVLVVGGGHAGIEAAVAAARAGARVAMITLRADAIGRMSCNPAVGGIGKGQLAREVDALGGLMGRVTDAAGIQFRLLNTSKGRAVQSPRAQCERRRYEVTAQALLRAISGLEIVEGEAVDFLWKGGAGGISPPRCGGLLLADGREIHAGAVILTTGTFLEGVLHSGREQLPGGRRGEAGAHLLGEALRRLGLPVGRLKTGTPPRIAADSVDYRALQEQPGDAEPTPFSFLTDRLLQPQICCWLTRTGAATHEIVRAHLHEAPMYAGRIQGRGPRYCPSIEDKVVRFAERESHVVFLEPEGYDSPILYANGISTSLPAEVQERFVRTIPGLEHARLLQPGYAVEYTFVRPGSLRRTLELRACPGLFLAGQICGTSGYEEAAAQGIMAGFNAALRAGGGAGEFVLGRHQAYIGVLIDDLVISDPSEPYRMFTSRAEHRLLLRHDNADQRLTPLAARYGAVEPERLRRLRAKEERRARALEALRRIPEPAAPGGAAPRSLLEMVRCHQDGGLAAALAAAPRLGELGLSAAEWGALEADVQYEGYVKRQQEWVERAGFRETLELPGDFDFAAVKGLRSEAREVLRQRRPETLGAAGRLAGVSPADLALLEVALVRRSRSACLQES